MNRRGFLKLLGAAAAAAVVAPVLMQEEELRAAGLLPPSRLYPAATSRGITLMEATMGMTESEIERRVKAHMTDKALNEIGIRHQLTKNLVLHDPKNDVLTLDNVDEILRTGRVSPDDQITFTYDEPRFTNGWWKWYGGIVVVDRFTISAPNDLEVVLGTPQADPD